MLNLTNFENRVPFIDAHYDYSTPKKSFFALAKIFGHCWKDGMENNPQCHKTQLLVKSFVQSHNFDFCKFWGQANLSDDSNTSNLETRCGRGDGWFGEEFTLEASFDQHFLRIYDVFKDLVLNCQAYLAIESSNSPSLRCHVNNLRL